MSDSYGFRQSSGALTVIIPTFNAAASLRATLEALQEGRLCGLIGEIVLVDGASSDETATLAGAEDIEILQVEAPSRGRQLSAGAEQARGPWLLFLHADTRLAAGWSDSVARFIGAAQAEDSAGYFTLQLDDAAPQARRIERLANWRARRLKLPYGDQGLLIHRSLYDACGGFRPLPLMEDVDFVRRLGRGRLRPIEGRAVTSAARYRRDGWWARPLRNLCLLSLYYLGLPPAWLQRLYG